MILEIQDIINSVSVPALIKDEFIKAGTFAKTRNGDAQVCVGGFSVVFPVEVNGTKWAFRCWHNTLDDSAQGRIRLLSSELQKLKLPYFIDFTYEDSGIFVNGRSFPTTRMKWINGRDLKDYICHYKNDRGKLFKLAGDFFEMTQDLHRMNIAHGDLQHENIIVSPYGKLYLIDYDSMYVPALSVNAKNTTNGKDGYQHPAREHCVYASKKLDYFSEAVILISILAIAYNPTLVDKYHLDDSDSLLFRKSDFQQFSKKPVYKDIAALGEPFDVLLKVMSFYLKQANIDTLDSIDITINKVSPTNVISLSEFICTAECTLRKKEDDEDDSDWNSAVRRNTSLAYVEYLGAHPNGRHSKDAKTKADELKILEENQRKKKAEDKERKEWNEALTFNTKIGYERFIYSHSNSIYNSEARRRISEFDDDELWDSVKSKRQISDIQDYLRTYPGGRHIIQAQTLLVAIREEQKDKIDWRNAKGVNTKESYKSYILKHPNGKYVHEAQKELDSFKQSSTIAIIFGIIFACIVIFIVISISSNHTSSSYSLPSSSSTQQAIPSNNQSLSPTNTSTLTPQEIKDLEQSTEKLIAGMETAKAIGDVIQTQSKSMAYSNLRKLEATGSSKYQSLKKRYDAL